ncbi:hypothetical protein [Ligilactobacillus salivarius]|uniref:hypothetical protein n=1 Tax=Ligilactobacillus salivarius TaxID=1624 RepID=UPI0025A4C35F|nr:hypothetical protein [Ligilactobacillus salivarius]MDM8261878.1 hypothetical protein [Ligilactobacillus salivarius]
MKINFDSKRELKELYQVGNVIENYGMVFLVCQQNYSSGKPKKYFLISLETGIVATGMYNSLDDLRKAAEDERDRLVKAKLIVDCKLGDAEDEDTE